MYALFAVAVAHPVLDIVARSPEFLVARRASAADVYAVVLALCVLLPSLAVVAEMLLWRCFPLLRVALRIALVGELTAFIALHVLGTLTDPMPAIAGAALVGIACGTGYLLAWPFRAFFTMLSPAVIAVPLVFLCNPGIRDLLAEPRTGTDGHGAARTSSVIVVVFDELPLASLLDARMQVDAGRFPHFAELARGSVWFRNTTTVAVATVEAVPALLSGRRPWEGSHPLAVDYPDNLFTLLQPTRRIVAHEAVTHLATQEPSPDHAPGLAWDMELLYEHWLLPAALHHTLPPLNEWMVPASSGDEAQRFDEFLAELRGPEVSTLWFHHCVLPHGPWNWLPSGRRYESTDPMPPEPRWSSSSWQVTHGMQRHLLQVAYVDALLGRLVARLRHRGLYDDTLLVVTADHGLTFAPGAESREEVAGHVDELTRVPLFVKMPRGLGAGTVRDDPAQLVDVLPTIADIVGVPVTWKVDGRSLLSPRGPRERWVLRHPDVATAPPDLEDAVGRRLHLFGASFGPRFHAIGPASSLVGRPLTALPRGSASDVEVRLDREGGVCVEGTVLADVARLPQAVVVATQGVVRAASPVTLSAEGVPRFAAMIPETARGPVRVLLLEHGVLHAAKIQ